MERSHVTFTEKCDGHGHRPPRSSVVPGTRKRGGANGPFARGYTAWSSRVGVAVGDGEVSVGAVNRRRRRLFVTTKRELVAIVRPASIGFSRPAAASGIAATLYANAQNRLPLITARVRRDRRIASAAALRSPRTSVRSLASIATSVPVPMARPRSACASAAASFTPSPTIATTLPVDWRRLIAATLP